MDRGLEEQLVTSGSLVKGVLGVLVDGRLAKGKGTFNASLLLSAVGCHTIILLDCLPVAMGHLLVKCGNTGGEGLGQPDRELNMRGTIESNLQLADCVSAAKGLMNTLQPVRTHKVLVVSAGVVQGAEEAHTFGHLLGHFRF